MPPPVVPATHGVAVTGSASRSTTPIKLAVSLAQLLSVLGTLVGVGIFGTPVRSMADGAFGPHVTLVSPATTAFVIWTPIYVGLFAYTLWAWLPGRRFDELLHSTGWLAATSMLLNAIWLLLAARGWVVATWFVIVAIVVTLELLQIRLRETPPLTFVEWVVIDLTYGLYLGWILFATVANTAVALVSLGVSPRGTWQTVTTCVVLVLLGGVGVSMARRFPGSWGIPIALVWGLAWVAHARSHEPAPDLWVALTTAVVAAVVAGAFAHTRKGGFDLLALRRRSTTPRG